jgi:hypothetical protein
MAVCQSAAILAKRVFDNTPDALKPGAQWRGDRLLLSIDRESVRFLAGSILYREDLDGFLAREFPSGLSVRPGRAGWFDGLSRFELPFCMSLAGTLALADGEAISGCAFWERFGSFYCSHRPDIQLAARDLRYVLDGLFALARFPELFTVCVNSIGERTRSSLPKGVMARDIAAFLGKLMSETGNDPLTLKDLPATVREIRQSPSEEAIEVRRVAHLRVALDKLERSAERAASVVERLQSQWCPIRSTVRNSAVGENQQGG